MKYLSINLTVIASVFAFALCSDAQSATHSFPIDTIERPHGILDGQNTVFSLQSIPDAASPMAVFINGRPQGSVRMTAGAKQIMIEPPPKPGDQILIRYREAVESRSQPTVRSLTNVLGGSSDMTRQLAAEALEREYSALIDQSAPSRRYSPSSPRSLQMLEQRRPETTKAEQSDEEHQYSTKSAAASAPSIELLRRRQAGRTALPEGGIDGLGDTDECEGAACDTARASRGQRDDSSIPASLQRLRAISAAHASAAGSNEPGTVQTQRVNHE